MTDIILKIYNESHTLLYVIFFVLFLFFRGLSFQIKTFITKQPVQSVEGRLLEYITKKTPWYFTVLFLLLIISGLLSILTQEKTFHESFKYISGSMVGALIGLAERYKAKEGE
jgi:F0F1-type ATP synthase assembly protein I